MSEGVLAAMLKTPFFFNFVLILPFMKKFLFASLLLNILFAIGFLFIIQKLGGLSYVWFKMNNRGITGTYEHRKTVFEMLPNKSGAIVFLGDSITEQCEWAELLQNNNIINRGISGDMTDGVLQRLPAILKHQPSKIFLMIGINDLILHSVEHILTNYKQILQQIQQQSPATKVYVQSVLPINNNLRQTNMKNSDILDINKGIQNLARQFDAEFINLHPQFIDNKGLLDSKYSIDGIHLNANGYLVWKDVVLPYL